MSDGYENGGNNNEGKSQVKKETEADNRITLIREAFDALEAAKEWGRGSIETCKAIVKDCESDFRKAIERDGSADKHLKLANVELLWQTLQEAQSHLKVHRNDCKVNVVELRNRLAGLVATGGAQ